MKLLLQNTSHVFFKPSSHFKAKMKFHIGSNQIITQPQHPHAVVTCFKIFIIRPCEFVKEVYF